MSITHGPSVDDYIANNDKAPYEPEEAITTFEERYGITLPEDIFDLILTNADEQLTTPEGKYNLSRSFDTAKYERLLYAISFLIQRFEKEEDHKEGRDDLLGSILNNADYISEDDNEVSPTAVIRGHQSEVVNEGAAEVLAEVENESGSAFCEEAIELMNNYFGDESPDRRVFSREAFKELLICMILLQDCFGDQSTFVEILSRSLDIADTGIEEKVDEETIEEEA